MPKILPKINTAILTKNFISISKAAKFLQVSPDTLRNWERQGRLLPSRTHGGARRYSTFELLKLKREIHPFTAHKKGLMSISIAAKALRVSPDTIRNWDKKGLIESSRTRGGARRFTRDEIRRLQKELSIEVSVIEPKIEPRREQKILPESPKSSHEIHNFTTAWLKITFPIVLIMLILVIGWFLGSYVAPLEKRLDDTSKLVTEIIQSIEALQKGVLGIQSQPEPNPVVLPSNLNTYYVSLSSGIVITSASAPVTLDVSTGQIGCVSCLTISSSYISSVTNSDGTLKLNLTDKTATVSLSLDHANTWLATQTFEGGVVTSGGNVGIGWTSPVNKLEVAGAQTIGSGYAGVYTAPANGLIVQGNVGIGISTPSYRLDVSGGARFGCGNDTWNSGPATNCSDIAEAYESDGEVDIGEIVVIAGKPNIVTKSSVPYQKGIIGIHSTSPGLILGGQVVFGGHGSLTDNQIPVALTGRVPVKVSDENGSIEVGDYLTSSTIPGVAMKATKAGPVIGQALESFGTTYEARPSTSEDTTHLVNIRLNLGKILVFVKVSYADPGNFFTSLRMDNVGNLIIPKIKVGSVILDPAIASASGQLTADSSSVILNPKSEGSSQFMEDSYATLQNDIANANNIYYDLTGKITSLEERIAALEAASMEYLVSGIEEEATTSAQPAQASTSLSQYSLSESASRNATYFTENTPDVSSSTSGVEDLNLTPPDILLATESATLANIKVTDTLSSDQLFLAQDGRFSGDLSVFGKTILGSTIIAGDLIVDGTLAINGSSINVIGSSVCLEAETTCGILYLQNSPLAYQVNFFNGLATIDKLGNLRAQTVIVSEFKVIGSKISGSGKISIGNKSVDLENSLVKSSSRILITPTSETDLVLAVTDKEEGKKFTVSTAQAAVRDISFDWFIINESSDK